MKRKLSLISLLVVFILLFSLLIAPAQAGSRPELSFVIHRDPCKPMQIASNINAGPYLMSLTIFNIPTPQPDTRPEAPVEHSDGRLNYRDCRAPLAVYLNDDGGVGVWSTDDTNLYAAGELLLSATPEEIAAALALAEETGEDVIIAGYVDGFALIAKPDGSLKAELIGVYGFDFYPDGAGNNGYGLPFEELPDF